MDDQIARRFDTTTRRVNHTTHTLLKWVEKSFYTLAMTTASAFIDWLQEHGGTVSPKIAIHDYSSEGAGNGVIALDDIKKGEVLFKVPRKLLLNGKNTQFKEELIRKKVPKEGWARIMWAVVLEKLTLGESQWKSYFDLVPERFNLPISWALEDRAFLEGTALPAMIGDPEAQFRSQFLPFASKFDQTRDLSIPILRDLYFYVGSLVSSYSFTEEDGQISLVPLADIFNHKTGHNNARLFFEKEHLQMIAIKDVARGEQLYNTYGDIGNGELLFKYGYLDDPNPFNQVEIGIQEMIDFAESHKCALHYPTDFKEASIPRLLEKDTIKDTAFLPAQFKIPWDLLRWFAKLYPQQSKRQLKGKEEIMRVAEECKGCIKEFLTVKLKSYRHRDKEPSNPNQILAKKLVKEEIAIIELYKEVLDKQQQ